MLVNYLKLALRLLLRNPFLTFINVLGLSVGFSVFYVLWEYSQHELKSDQYHKDVDKIVRLTCSWTQTDETGGEGKKFFGGFTPGFAKYLTEDYDEFKTFTRIYAQRNFNKQLISDHGSEVFLSILNGKHKKVFFKETNLVYADPNVLDFFSLPLIKGNVKSVLQEPNSFVISETMAKKYFGKEEPVGEMIFINDSIPLQITGVFKNLPDNTHLQFDGIMSTNRIAKTLDKNMALELAFIYFKLNKDVDRDLLAKRLNVSSALYLVPIFRKFNLNPSDYVTMYLQPLKDIAFASLGGDIHKLKSRQFLNLLLVVSITVLLMAWINYVNLMIYVNGKRMKEIGVRRTLGARYADFNMQFVTETMLTFLFAICFSLTFIQLFRFPLEILFEFYVPSPSLSTTIIMLSAITTGILITGIYPTHLTLKKSVKDVFKNVKSRASEFAFSKWLTTFQFASSITIIILIFSIYRQLDYVLNMDIGVERNNVIIVDLPDASRFTKVQLNSFLGQLDNLGLTQRAVSSFVMGDDNRHGITIQRSTASKVITVDTNGGVDENFIPFYNVKLIAGTNFDVNPVANENALIVSRRVVELLNIETPEAAIGQTFLVEKKQWTHENNAVRIIGVIEDYSRKPLFNNTNFVWKNEDGVALTYYDYVNEELVPQKISFRLDQPKFEETIKKVAKFYDTTFPTSSFHWYFLDDNLNRHYQTERIERNQMVMFTVLSIGIACLGVLGMISNKSKEKTKEIAIRKILGANVPHIIQILLNSTVRQIILATILALPLASFLVEQYLEKFSQRITLQWWHYALPILMLLLILFATVSVTILNTIRTNPVDSLRYE